MVEIGRSLVFFTYTSLIGTVRAMPAPQALRTAPVSDGTEGHRHHDNQPPARSISPNHSLPPEQMRQDNCFRPPQPPPQQSMPLKMSPRCCHNVERDDQTHRSVCD